MKITNLKQITCMLAGAITALALTAPLAVMAQTTVFSDNFANGSTLNGTSTPGGTPTASSTSYDIASSKAATTGPSIASGDFKLALNSATTSGFVEAQALFTATPVKLATVGDYIDFTYTFTNTAGLLAGGANSAIYTGLYNSGGSTPVAGLLNNSGLSTASGSTYATGNAANWQGYVGRINASGGTSQNYSRPLQNGAGTSSANQELIGNNFGSGAFDNPTNTATFSGGSLAGVSLTAGNQYTVDYRLTLSAVGVLTISQNLYSGVGTNGADLSSQTAVTTSTLLTNSFDGLAIGVRNSGTSFNPTMDISQITILTATNPTDGLVFLVGNYLYLPIQTNGVFLAANTGAKYNFAGTGGASGVDFWEPGTPVYNYNVGVGGTQYLNGSAPMVGGFASLTVSNLSSGVLQRALINGVVIPGLSFTRDISFAINSKVVRIMDTLQNTSAMAMTNVVTLDTADPDQDIASTNSTFLTLNDVVSVNLSNDMVVASGPVTGLSVGFGSDSGLQIPSAVGYNIINAYSNLFVVDPNGASADIDINLAQNYGTLAAGQSQSVIWYTVFGDSEMEVTNAFAIISSNAPSITSQPVSVTVPVGNTANFTVGAVGTAPLNYIWLRNGAYISGATSATYTTNNVQLSDSGSQFSCMVSNAYETVISFNATLTVVASMPPVAYLQSQWLNNQMVLSWTNAGFTLQSAPAVTGTFTNIPGATSPYTNPAPLAQQFFRLVQ